MKKLFLVALFIFGSLGAVHAGIRVEVPSENAIGSFIMDSLIISSDAIWSDAIATADAIDVSAVYATTGIWSNPARKPDASTHYIDGLDTVITRHRIECDTTTIEKIIIKDTTVIRLEVECDTIYRVGYRPVWKPKVKVFLEPEQLKILVWLLEHSDEIEMKKTYGQKE